MKVQPMGANRGMRYAMQRFGDVRLVGRARSGALFGGVEGDAVSLQKALDLRQPALDTGLVTEKVVAVRAERRLQQILGAGAAGLEALEPALRRRRAIGGRSRFALRRGA
jgi:hypothetical protein